jgi:hypothetical protein
MDYREVDEILWNEITAGAERAMQRQLEQARIDYALTMELGARAAYALTFGNF